MNFTVKKVNEDTALLAFFFRVREDLNNEGAGMAKPPVLADSILVLRSLIV